MTETGERALQRTLLAIAIVSGVLLIADLYFDGQAEPAAVPDSGTAPTPAVADPANLGPIEEFGVIAERPLFFETRRAPVPVAPVAERNRTPPEEMELSAVVIARDHRMAILATRGEAPQKISLGESIRGWKLVDVEPNRVTLNRGEEVRELELSISGRDGAAAGPDADAPAGRTPAGSEGEIPPQEEQEPEETADPAPG